MIKRILFFIGLFALLIGVSKPALYLDDLGYQAEFGTTDTLVTQSLSVSGSISTTTLFGSSYVSSPSLYGNLLLSRIGNSTYSNVQHLMNFSLSPGISSGGSISDGTSGTINIAAGTGFLKANDSNVDTNSFMDFSQSVSSSIPISTTRYVGVKLISGSAQVTVTSSEAWDLDTSFPLGTIVNEGNTLYILNNPWITSDNMANVIERFDSDAYVTRDNRIGGLVIGNTGTRNVTVSAGALLARMSEYNISALDTSAASRFDAYYRDGVGGWKKQSSNSQWNNTSYDDGTGTLAAIPLLTFSSRWFYLMADGSLAMLYGQQTATSLAVILDDSVPSSVPDRIGKMGILIGRIVAQQGSNTPGRVQSAFGNTFTAANVENHNDLANIQGGTTGEYYHLTSAQATSVTNIDSIYVNASGDTMTGLLTASSGVSITGNLTVTGSISSSSLFVLGSSVMTSTTADSAYVNITGDTMTGVLTVPGLTATGGITGTTINASGIIFGSTSVSTPLLSSTNISAARITTTSTIVAGGLLTASSNASITGNATITNNLTVDTNSLVVNGSSNNVGMGISPPTARLHTQENTSLGTTAGNSQILMRTTGLSSNASNRDIWLKRDSNGSDWNTASIHDSLSVDASFLTPGTDTRTWWERNAFTNTQKWGSANLTYMTLFSGGNLGIGTTNSTSVLSVSGTTSITGLLTASSGISVTGNETVTGKLDVSGIISGANINSSGSISGVSGYFSGNLGIGDASPGNLLFSIKASPTAADPAGMAASAISLFQGNGNAQMVLASSGVGTIANFAFGDDADYNIGGITYDHSDDHLSFRVNDSEHMHITSAGVVQIETSLRITGTATFGETSAAESEAEVLDESGDSYLTISNNASDSSSGIYFKRRRTGSVETGGASIQVVSEEDSANTKLEFHTLSSMVFPTGDTSAIRFDRTGVMVTSTNAAQVGIGQIYDPTATLHVQQSMRASSITGTVTVASGSTSVSFTNSNVAVLNVGDPVRILNTAPSPDEATYYTLTAITATEGTLDTVYVGTSASGVTMTRASQTADIFRVDNGDAKEFFSIGWNGVAVFNEDSKDTVDVRMETDNQANAFFLDSSIDSIGFFTSAPSASTHISSTTLIGTLTPGASLPVTNSTGNLFMVETGTANVSSGNQDPADQAILGRLNFFSSDTSAGARQVSGYILSRNTAGSAWSATSTTWDANLELGTINDGVLSTKVTIAKDGLLTASNGVSVTGNLTVTGQTVDNLDVSNRISVTGNATIGGKLAVGAAATPSTGQLEVVGLNTVLSLTSSGETNSKLVLHQNGDSIPNLLTYPGSYQPAIELVSSNAVSQANLIMADDAFRIISRAPIIFGTGTSTAPTDRGTIDTGGNWGIGTTAPTAVLSVSGSASITGNVTIAGSTSISQSLDFSFMDMNKFLYIAEDFIGNGSLITGGFSNYSWSFVFADSGGTDPVLNSSYSASTTDQNHFGVLTLVSGDDNSNQNQIHLGINDGQVLRLGGGALKYEGLIYIPILSTAGDEFDIIFGLCSNVASVVFTNCTNGVYFKYDRNTSANWLTVTCNNTTCTTTTTSTAVANGSWIKLSAVVSSDGVRVQWFINGVKMATDHTANIPTAAGREISPTITISRSASTATRNVSIDYFNLGVRFTTPR